MKERDHDQTIKVKVVNIFLLNNKFISFSILFSLPIEFFFNNKKF